MMKRANGVYYTEGNPFNNSAFKDWASEAGLPKSDILEPYAGSNKLIETLSNMNLCDKYQSFDIQPKNKLVKKRNTLCKFPKGFNVCVTNPPWLAKNSASARGLPFPKTHYGDLYHVALEKCLDNCSWVATLVPESFIRANLFRDRLVHFVSLTPNMFGDTTHPVGLALFSPDDTREVMVWRDSELIGQLSMLERNRPPSKPESVSVTFNVPSGNVGLIALDNTLKASIRFCDVSELSDYEVKPTGRHITKISVDGEIRIKDWNDCLKSFRAITGDVLMTCYKGIRKDGWYRRRLDWDLVRGIINYVH